MSICGRIWFVIFAWFPVLMFVAGRFNPEGTRPAFLEEWSLYTSTMEQAFPRR
jgi:hypothetical protein